MNQIRSVLDYGAKKLRVTLQDDLHNFRLKYRVTQKSAPSPYLRSSHEIAFTALPKIEGLLSVITAFNPNSPCLGSAHDMVHIIQASAATGFPPIPDLSKLASRFSRKEDMDTALDGIFMPPPTPAVLNIPIQGDVSASNPSHIIFEIFGEENAENLVTHSGKGSAVLFSDDIGCPTLAARMSSNVHGHVMFPAKTQHKSDVSL